MKVFGRLHLDPLVLLIVASVLLAGFLPARGAAENVAIWLAQAAVAALFVLYGARLAPEHARLGVKRWPLHTTILICTFGVFPLLGLIAYWLASSALPSELLAGVLFLCIVPSTTLSSIAFTAIAGGSESDSVIAASASNLLGMFLTPLLVVLVSGSGEGGVPAKAMVTVVVVILLPFLFGVLVRPLVTAWLAGHKRQIKFAERMIVTFVVYAEFSLATDQNVWTSTSVWHLVDVVVLCAALFGAMLGVTVGLGTLLRFAHEEKPVLQFAGMQKSIAVGLPLASVLFTDGGLIALPLIIYYQLQITAGGALAAAHAARRRKALAANHCRGANS